MTPEPFPGLNLSFPLLVVVVIILISIEIGVRLKRSRPYAVAIWLPLVTVTGLACIGIIGLFIDCSHLAPGDMASLAFVIDFIFLIPWIIAFIGALICRPLFRQQDRAGWIIGSLISVIMVIGLLVRGEITEATKFIVLNPRGEPIPNQTFLVASSHYGNPSAWHSVTTNRKGIFTLWLTPGKSIFLNASTDSLSGNVSIWNQEDITLFNRTSLNTYCDWDYSQMHQYGHRWGTFPVSIGIGQKTPVALILKSNTDLTSPYIKTAVRSALLQARDGACPLDLSQLVSNPEALEQLDLISEVMAKQPSTRPALLQGLQWSGQFVISLNSAANPHIQERGFDAIRCLYVQWFNLTPNTTPQLSDAMTPAFRQKVDALALQIISTVKPYLGTEPGASGVIREMGAAGRPAIPDFAQAFPSATKQCQDQMLNSLWALRPKVSDLGWLVESGEPRLVFAGYEAARDAIKPEERDLAKERVDDALTRATTPGEINFGKTLSANIGRVSVGPIMDRGIAFARQGDEANALIAFDRVIQLDQYNSKGYVYRGLTHVQLGNSAKAVADFNHAIEVDSYNSEAYNSLAWLLATSPQANFRDGKEAVEKATKACELSEWENPNFVDTLAASYAELGDFDNAVKWENKYLETPNLSASDAAGGKNRLALYQMHQPYRDVK